MQVIVVYLRCPYVQRREYEIATIKNNFFEHNMYDMTEKIQEITKNM